MIRLIKTKKIALALVFVLFLLLQYSCLLTPPRQHEYYKKQKLNPSIKKNQLSKPVKGLNHKNKGSIVTTRPLVDINYQRKMWALIIGISKYKYQKGLKELIYADDDALDISAMLLKLNWKKSHIKMLINEQATNMNIRIAIESWLTKAKTKDLVFIYWSGHGYPDPEIPDKVYFACYDTQINIPATGYRMDKVRDSIEELNVKNVIILADTCHAGKIITRGNNRVDYSLSSKFKNITKIPKGWIFMVSADSDRTAIESSSWSNGAFTHCVLEALSGKADGYMSSDYKDGIITMAELKTYISYIMPDITQKVLGVSKHPIITTSTGDPKIWKLTLQTSSQK